MRDETKLIHAGRHPERFEGAVNPPVFHASTIISPTLADWDQKTIDRANEVQGTYYGRGGTPTTHALQDALAELEGAHRCVVYSSGLGACTGALLAYLSAGDHVLMSDSVYGPARHVAQGLLKRYGVSTSFYDPLIGAGIAQLMRPNTKVVYVESPGSLTFEVQDIPAIAEVAHRQDAMVLMDNTWATPLYFKAIEHGVDVSIQAATKYVVGHADAMLGMVSCNKRAWPQLKSTHYDLGQTAGPDDLYLAQRGLRTMGVRLKQHWETGVQLAQWLAARPEVEKVMHPALPGDPGHALWKRDFKGACGLFGIVLRPIGKEALRAFIDGLQLFGLGASWGGYESLIMPFSPERSVTRWPYAGPCVRIHAGLEHVDDLIADLSAGLECLNRAR